MITFKVNSKNIDAQIFLKIDATEESIDAGVDENPAKKYPTRLGWYEPNKTFFDNLLYAWAWFCETVSEHGCEIDDSWFTQLPMHAFIHHNESNPPQEDNTILIWRFEDAPAIYQAMSTHGGDEDWVVFIPAVHKHEWMSCLAQDYCCSDMVRIPVHKGEILIMAHA